ncbi:Tip attachment protein J [uncultured Caudovirales phage]|uniref:Tip attachment protein J n=1 Tax=uncultured Caudovirales phage TaxID=2100421 RepID=A0A6J5QS48_9CAUD|nr:Tip attachment protein J [uncultured Caudovirales phage]CAB4219261.1 Tip attachment protein J [uncultured Caudovirales phage]
MRKFYALLFLLFFSIPAFAVGTIIAVSVMGLAAGSFAAVAVAFAINMVVSAVISKALFSPTQPSMDGSGASQAPNPGNRQQIPPATDNKLPVVYGDAWVGGTIVDLSISENNQDIYYVLALSEVTNSNTGQTPDTITFGDIYYGGKKVIFQGDGRTVASLLDESTGESNTQVNGLIQFFLYSNGSNSPTNTPQSAIEVMQTAGLVYKWNSTKLMTNCAFMIIHLTYNGEAGIRGIEQTKIQVRNSRYKPGDVYSDYLINTRYGAALPASQIDYTSLTALNTYCDEAFTYTDYDGFTSTQTRFRFDGTVDTTRSIMQNLQDMASCCDCLLKYTEITAKWGVIVQKPSYTVAMALNDSNICSAIQITPLDLSNSFNVAECKFPDKQNQDAFNSTTFDLAEIDPALLFPNEPVNKQSISLPLVNDDVRAQYLANRFLKSAREDLQVDCSVNFVGIQLEAGDIVSLTNVNYGWVAKLFRINKITETFEESGAIVCKLLLMEFNPSVYDDVAITQFTPSPNTGIGSPTTFGTLTAPTVSSSDPAATIPYFNLQVITASAGITQYAEVWYSAFSSPTASQLIFIGTSEIQSDGTPWNPNTALPPITVANIPAGNWYFFSRMVNSLASSPFSSASSLLQWRPSTYQFTERYLAVAYADNATGTSNFSLSPTNRLYYGLLNTSQSSGTHPANEYTWFLADPAFSTNVYLCYINRQNRKFSFDTGFAIYAAGTGAFVPSQALIFDPRLWAALPDGSNYIDLDASTGQLLSTGTTTVGTGEISVSNTQDGKVVASLKQYLDFGSGVYSKTATGLASLTIDIYGRVVGFTIPDYFYFTAEYKNATSGQTVFTVTRGAGYISGQCLVFKNGVLLDTSEYTDTGGTTGTVTLGTACALNDQVCIQSFKSVASTGGAVYATFTRTTATLTNQASYTPASINSGFEFLFMNGSQLNEQDYDIVGGVITNMPSLATGLLTIIQWTPNNLTTPNGDPVNILINSIIGQTAYNFGYTAGALNLYMNGSLLTQGVDYNTVSGGYVLTNTPNTVIETQMQQTFARTGAV